MSAVWCGAERYSHLDITRLDHTLQRLYGKVYIYKIIKTVYAKIARFLVHGKN